METIKKHTLNVCDGLTITTEIIARDFDPEEKDVRNYDGIAVILIKSRYRISGAEYTDSNRELAEMEQELEAKGYERYPLYVYDHSGVSFSTSRACGWDSSLIGYVFFKCDALLKQWLNVMNADCVYNIMTYKNDDPFDWVDGSSCYDSREAEKVFRKFIKENEERYLS